MIIHSTSTIPIFSGTVTDYLRSKPSFSSSDPAYIDVVTGKSISYSEVWKLADKLSSALYNEHGIKDPKQNEALGPIVMLHASNSPLLASVHYALLDLGVTITPAAATYEAGDLKHQISVCKPELVVCNRDFESKVKTADPNAKILFIEDLLNTQSSAPWKKFTTTNPKRVAYLGMSSGTSGLPKAAQQTHINLSSSTEAVITSQTLFQQKNVTAAIVPMTHVYGLTKFVFHSVAGSMTTVVFPKFGLVELLEAQIKYKINVLYLVPPVVLALAKDARVQPYIKSLNEITTLIATGAAPLPPTAGDALLERLTGNKDGLREGRDPLVLIQGYGLTETLQVAVFKPDDPDRDLKTVGKLLPNTEIRIVGEKGDVPRSKWSFVHPPTGEIYIRGPHVTPGYFNNDQANAESFDGEWLKTGDIGFVDLEGRLTIVDRNKEMIKVNGRQVAPAEIESVLLGHPQVKDVAVIGVTNPDRGTESARAFIVTEARALPVIKQWFDRRVPSYKRLYGGIVVVDSIPKSASGKILRRVLRERKGDNVFGEYVQETAKL
ncbi:putative 4-coumarate--CoA ligase 1 [Yarrowia sp. B02]|nr:putative 4-coumarate--CoA ligase 1 [Yarrowia sp. B02]